MANTDVPADTLPVRTATLLVAAMPGHFGVERVTVQNLEIVKVDEERNLLLIKGAVPGANGGLLLVRNTCKA